MNHNGGSNGGRVSSVYVAPNTNDLRREFDEILPELIARFIRETGKNPPPNNPDRLMRMLNRRRLLTEVEFRDYNDKYHFINAMGTGMDDPFLNCESDGTDDTPPTVDPDSWQRRARKRRRLDRSLVVCEQRRRHFLPSVASVESEDNAPVEDHHYDPRPQWLHSQTPINDDVMEASSSAAVAADGEAPSAAAATANVSPSPFHQLDDDALAQVWDMTPSQQQASPK